MTYDPQTTRIEITPGKDGSLSFVLERAGAYAYIDCGPGDALHVFSILPGQSKFEFVGLMTSPELLNQLELIEGALNQ